jgi:hypothetical protein
MFDKWVRKDFRSAEKITIMARTREKPCFGPWMTSPLEARRNRVKKRPLFFISLIIAILYVFSISN